MHMISYLALMSLYMPAAQGVKTAFMRMIVVSPYPACGLADRSGGGR